MALPIRARLTLVSAALMAVVLAAVGGFLYIRLRGDLLEAVDAGLRSRAETLLAGLEIVDGGGVAQGSGLIEPEDAFAQVFGPSGLVIESSPGLGGRRVLSAEEVAALQRPRFFEEEVPTAEEQVVARFLAIPAPGGAVLVVGASLDDQTEALTRLAVLLAVGGPLALLLATGVGWLVTGAALRPVERMRVEAAEISASEPGRRLPVPTTGDEVARLGETLNAMLQRLEEALARERRFVDEASHELRTPLANLRTELDLALRRSRSVEELESGVRSASDETERLSRLAEDLLVLARSDRGRLPVRRESTELAPLVEDAMRTFASRAEKDSVSIEAHVPGGLRANLDPLRIRQALGNLLDNALRHTPPGGRVMVSAARENGGLFVAVRDTGEGFPDSFLPSAFLPFARPEGARSRHDGGTGLGLAIVQAIAEAHGGEVKAGNHPDGGASVELHLPE